jgi:hypothetical protein
MKRAVTTYPKAQDAIAKYKEFHRYDPKTVGSFPKSFSIPNFLYKAGTSKWVTYESTKVDPESLKKPRNPVSYIHEHDAGVTTYLAYSDDILERHPTAHLTHVRVPSEFRDVPALTRLGFCLGFCFDGPDGKSEAEATRPYPDLYTVPDGRCLLVIQSRREVIAMMWGGGLGVFARGIDG